MRKMIIIGLNDLRIFFASRENLFGLLALPIFFTFIVGAASGMGGQAITRLRVDVLDEDATPESAQFIAALREANPLLYLCPADDGQGTLDCELADNEVLTLESSQDRVRNGDTYALIVIPENYSADLQAFTPVAFPYYSLGDALSGDIVYSALEAAVEQVNSAAVAAQVGTHIGEAWETAESAPIFTDEADKAVYTQAVYDRAEALLQTEPLTINAMTAEVTDANRSLSSTQGFGQSVPGMGAMFVMFTVLGALPTLIKERKQWTLQRLVMMPVTRMDLIGGKILAYFILGILQYGVVFLVGLVTGTNFGSAPLALALVMAAFVLCVTAMTLALATWVKTENQANGLSFLLAMTLAPLGGAWWPLEITPPFMQLLARFSPVSWAMDGFRSVIFYGGGFGEVVVPVLVLLTASLVLFGIGVRGFKYE